MDVYKGLAKLEAAEKKTGVTTMGRLANKNILITGGNSGIGLAAAQEFDREGARRHLRLE